MPRIASVCNQLRNPIVPARISFIGMIVSISLMLSLLLVPLEVLAEPLVSAFSGRQGSFAIHANNLNRMIEAEIRIDYQSEELSPPQVSSLADRRTATLTSSAASPGSLVIKIKSSKPLSGYVPLATVPLRGSITFLTAYLRNENGTTESTRVSITNPTREQLDEWAARQAKSDQAESPATSGVSGATAGVADTVVSGSMPSARSDAPPPPASKPERTVQPQMKPLVGSSGAPLVAVVDDRYRKSGDTPPAFTFSRRESLFERFSALPGEHRSDGLARLLERRSDDFIQAPPLLLATGNVSLKVTIRPSGQSVPVSQFHISGGHCTELKIGENGSWILEIMPDQGVLNGSVTVQSGSEAVEYPLSIAPPLEMFDAEAADSPLIEFVRAANALLR